MVDSKQLPINTRYSPLMEKGFYICVVDTVGGVRDVFFSELPEYSNREGLEELASYGEYKDNPTHYAMAMLSYQVQKVTGDIEWDANMLTDFAFLAGPYESRLEATQNAKEVFATRYKKD